MNHESETLYSDDERKVLELYRQQSVELPSTDISKVIIAAAHREAEKSLKKAAPFQIKTTFWDRLRIPVSIAGAMVMTLTLAHVMWPMIDISGERVANATKAQAPAHSVQLESTPVEVEQAVSEMDVLKQKHSRNQSLRAKASSFVNTDAFYDLPSEEMPEEHKNQSANSDRDQWVKKIVSLAEAGEFNRMNKELKSFAAEYPDFPIEKLIRPFLR